MFASFSDVDEYAIGFYRTTVATHLALKKVCMENSNTAVARGLEMAKFQWWFSYVLIRALSATTRGAVSRVDRPPATGPVDRLVMAWNTGTRTGLSQGARHRAVEAEPAEAVETFAAAAGSPTPVTAKEEVAVEGTTFVHLLPPQQPRRQPRHQY